MSRSVSRRSPDELCREAIRLLEDAMQKPPADLKAEVDSAERAVAALRDELIERLRAAADPRTRDALNTVNVALTLVVGLEYPMGGVQREMLEQARDALQATLPAVSAASV